MEKDYKGGRRPHGHNGGNISCKLTRKSIEEVSSSYEILQSKPTGSCKMDECNNSGQKGKTEINICTYNVRTLRNEEVYWKN